VLGHTEALTERVQRALTPRNALAQEYAESEISALFPANGNSDPGTEEYVQMAQRHFADWHLAIDGLVAKPTTFSFASLRGIGGGKGGYWEDQGYEWYAGI
jgi:DMSO/TMAO reductase YedYZ molybdopterin-dependent catalytic subunit